MNYSKNIHLIVIFFVALFMTIALSAQSPYQLNWKRESPYIATAAIVNGFGLYFREKIPLLTPDEVAILDATTVNSFDRFATRKYSINAKNASDIFWGSSHVLPLLFLANEKSRTDFGTIAALYGEVFFVNGGLTLLTKATIRRTRPFVYNSEVALEEKLETNAQTAFFSGHTSFTAANTFFVAKVFSDYYPDSKWKPMVWVLATTIPAATGYFRVAAGKHYPTDVITGYLVGAAVGILVPHFHKRKKDSKVAFYGGLNGGLLQVRF